MTKTLEERLRRAAAELKVANSAVLASGSTLLSEVREDFEKLTSLTGELEHWVGLIKARTAARALLSDLSTKADDDGGIMLGGIRVPFPQTRLIGVQAYLATTWSLADSLTGVVGRILCIGDGSGDPVNAPSLVSHFVAEDRKKRTASLCFKSLANTFGRPITISYALRNHFIHDGGKRPHVEPFFAGTTAESCFRVSETAWKGIVRTADTYAKDVRQPHNETWPEDPCADLLVVLDFCERELDNALGILVGSACRSLTAHIGFLLGDD